MPLLNVVIILVVIGIGLYLLNKYVPLDAKVKTILNWVVIIAIVLWLLSLFGIFSGFSGLSNVRVGK